jgi:hypothetical protein
VFVRIVLVAWFLVGAGYIYIYIMHGNKAAENNNYAENTGNQLKKNITRKHSTTQDI